MKIKFYLRTPESEGKTSIIARVAWSQHRLNKSTGISIKPNDWNEKEQTVKKSEPNYSVFNTSLKKLITLYEGAIVEFEKIHGTVPKLDQFKEFVPKYKEEQGEKIPTKKDTFFEFAADVIEKQKERIKIEGGALSRNNYANHLQQTIDVLKDFEKQKDFEISYDTIDQNFWIVFTKWCLTKKKYKVNTAGKHIKNVKYFMNKANEKGKTTNQAHKSRDFKILKEDVHNVALSFQEIDTIRDLDLSDNSNLERSRDLFLLGCHTGLRISDYGRIKDYHIVKDETGHYIRIKVQKSRKYVQIPVHVELEKILSKYNYNVPRLSEQKLNLNIKKICKMAGIDKIETYETQVGLTKKIIQAPKYELISSHSGRRSFATNLYNLGVPTLVIRNFTGHKTESSFLLYLKVTPEDHRKRMEKIMEELYEKKVNSPMLKIA